MVLFVTLLPNVSPKRRSHKTTNDKIWDDGYVESYENPSTSIMPLFSPCTFPIHPAAASQQIPNSEMQFSWQLDTELEFNNMCHTHQHRFGFICDLHNQLNPRQLYPISNSSLLGSTCLVIFCHREKSRIRMHFQTSMHANDHGNGGKICKEYKNIHKGICRSDIQAVVPYRKSLYNTQDHDFDCAGWDTNGHTKANIGEYLYREPTLHSVYYKYPVGNNELPTSRQQINFRLKLLSFNLGAPLGEVLADLIDQLGFALREYYKTGGRPRQHPIPRWALILTAVSCVVLILALAVEWLIVRKKLIRRRTHFGVVADSIRKTHMMF
ncbi:hypothetical protein DdX_07268 [Ditylenchus destructor]|uniref:Uncharacterized protein n=1 Tax=Ditylenchus destructor TaxID=166010 RepID=A0AAD4N5X5_9BILA|nr:hypothetical protein DdX_07268 [Ditylenchus destructor]